MKKYPKQIVVERCEDGTQDEHLMVHNCFEDAAVVGESVTVGIYELKETRRVVAIPELK